jgi:U6 snRNA-associated Sm-like protein LSm4
MLPLSLLTTTKGHPILVELKNGETFNGHLVNCDNFMNLTLQNVIQTSSNGDRFWKIKECYIRGSTIKYLRVPDEMIDIVKEESTKYRKQQQQQQQQQQRGNRNANTNQSRGSFTRQYQRGKNRR